MTTVVPCTTVERVKALLGIEDTDTSQDDVLSNYIVAVSQRIDQWVDRRLTRAQWTEELDVVGPRQASYFVVALPVYSITSIKNDPAWDFANVAAIDSTLYRHAPATGQIHMRTQLSPGPRALQVVYEGGLALDTDDVLTNHAPIANACEVQVCAAYRRRSSPQGAAVSAGGGSIGYERQLEFTHDVIEALSPYRRVRFGV